MPQECSNYKENKQNMNLLSTIYTSACLVHVVAIQLALNGYKVSFVPPDLL